MFKLKWWVSNQEIIHPINLKIHRFLYSDRVKKQQVRYRDEAEIKYPLTIYFPYEINLIDDN